jgi:glucose/arabinose dehydrogenase
VPVILDRVLRVLIAAVAMCLLGCGGGGDSATARGTATPTPTATETPAATPTPEAKVTAKPGLRLRRIGSFSNPVYVTSPPQDRRRLFVVEQGGRVRIVRDGNTVERPFLDVSDRISTGSERGLLSLAFAPDYRSSGLFYVYYTATDGDIRIVEYRRSSVERADHDSARIVLSVSHPVSNHNGGLVLFGPDGLL